MTWLDPLRSLLMGKYPYEPAVKAHFRTDDIADDIESSSPNVAVRVHACVLNSAVYEKYTHVLVDSMAFIVERALNFLLKIRQEEHVDLPVISPSCGLNDSKSGAR
jgi:hypothetical protein